MIPAVIDRTGTFGLVATKAPGRPVVGGVLHNTVTQVVVGPSGNGSWQWQIDRDGIIYRDVPESGWCAYHVRAADRYRPGWVQRTPPKYQPLSDVNWSATGIELVSFAGSPACPPDYLPYTDEQYESLAWLIAHDELGRREHLPWVGHGELQLDRSDPVGFDWGRAGFSPFDPVFGGRHFKGTETMPILNDAQREEIARAVWMNIPFNPNTAIARAWLAEWVAGRNRGRPLTEETAFSGGVWQSFVHGLAVYLPGQPVSWDG